MIMKYPIIKGGLLRWSNKNEASKSELSLITFIKKILKTLHVTFLDDCCPVDPDNLPVKFDSFLGSFVYWDGTQWVVPIGTARQEPGQDFEVWDGYSWSSPDGAVRFYNGVLEYWDGTQWVAVS